MVIIWPSQHVTLFEHKIIIQSSLPSLHFHFFGFWTLFRRSVGCGRRGCGRVVRAWWVGSRRTTVPASHTASVIILKVLDTSGSLNWGGRDFIVVIANVDIFFAIAVGKVLSFGDIQSTMRLIWCAEQISMMVVIVTVVVVIADIIINTGTMFI